MNENISLKSSGATMTAQRWTVRVLSILYYLMIGPLLYDVFMYGIRWRSVYLLFYVLLSVAGLQIGYKQDDLLVRMWYWINLPFVLAMSIFAFFSRAVFMVEGFFSWEKWVHLSLFLLCVLMFLPLHFLLPRKPMKRIGEDEEKEFQNHFMPQA